MFCKICVLIIERLIKLKELRRIYILTDFNVCSCAMDLVSLVVEFGKVGNERKMRIILFLNLDSPWALLILNFINLSVGISSWRMRLWTFYCKRKDGSGNVHVLMKQESHTARLLTYFGIKCYEGIFIKGGHFQLLFWVIHVSSMKLDVLKFSVALTSNYLTSAFYLVI